MTIIANNNKSTGIPPSKQTCCAIIVTYNPDRNVKDRLNNISKQLPNLVIIDNGSSKFSITLLQEFAPSHSVTLIQNRFNMGLGYALNQGIDYAKNADFEWVLLLDQDSSINPTLLTDLNDTWQQGGCVPAIIGCNYINTYKKTVKLSNGKEKKSYVNCKTVITSGTLLPLCIPDHIGKFRADYFIDSIDHEYCLRARKYGYPIRLCKSIGMVHTIGSGPATSIFGHPIAHVHTPTRKYYIARNTLLTVKKYFMQEPLWSLRQITRLGVEFMSILILENNKALKIKAFLNGLYHAFKNKTGQLYRAS